jgi:hypothetical protein
MKALVKAFCKFFEKSCKYKLIPSVFIFDYYHVKGI